MCSVKHSVNAGGIERLDLRDTGWADELKGLRGLVAFKFQFRLVASTARIMPVSASASPSGADPVSRTVVRSAANFQWGRQGYCPPPHWKLPRHDVVLAC